MTAIRRPGTASAALLVGLSLSLVAAHAVAPDWSRRAGLDVWNIASLERAYENAAEEQADVYALEERATARRAAANQVATELIADPTRLPTAADELSEVFRQDSGMRFVLKSLFPAAPSERHVYARHAISRIEYLLKHDPARRAAVLARLEAEYASLGTAPASPLMP